MVFKSLYDKILNSSNSYKFYKNQYTKLKKENKHIWRDIRRKDKIIKDKDNLINLKNKQLKDKDNTINRIIKDKDSTIDSKNKTIKDKDNTIHRKDNIIGDKDNFINELKKDLEILKVENKSLLNENRQLLNHNIDMRKAIDENENLRHEYVETSKNLDEKLDMITNKSNKILSFVEFSQVESSNNFSEITSKLDDNMETLLKNNK